MESIALLTNLLHREIQAHPEAKPSKDALDMLFREYQKKQIPRTRKIMKFANSITRVQAWDGFWMKLMALWVVPFQSEKKRWESTRRRRSCGTMKHSRKR